MSVAWGTISRPRMRRQCDQRDLPLNLRPGSRQTKAGSSMPALRKPSSACILGRSPWRWGIAMVNARYAIIQYLMMLCFWRTRSGGFSRRRGGEPALGRREDTAGECFAPWGKRGAISRLRSRQPHPLSAAHITTALAACSVRTFPGLSSRSTTIRRSRQEQQRDAHLIALSSNLTCVLPCSVLHCLPAFHTLGRYHPVPLCACPPSQVAVVMDVIFSETAQRSARRVITGTVACDFLPFRP